MAPDEAPAHLRGTVIRIIQVHNRYRQAGGEDALVRTERDLLRGAGHAVLAHETTNPSGASRSVLKLVGAPWNPVSSRSLRTQTAAFRPDVAHVHNTWFALSPAVVAALKREGVPVVMTLHNYRLLCANGLLFRDGHPCTDCVGTHPGHGIVHRCYRDSATLSAVAGMTIGVHHMIGTWQRHVDLFLTPSAAARGWMIEGGLQAGRVRVKPNSVPDPGSRETPPSASRSVLAVGRLSAERGIEDVLRAWSRASVDDLELVIVGDGPLRADLEKMAPQGVRFTGALEPTQVRRLMLTARALLFPTRWYEPFGLVAAEAMAAALPVVASDIGALPEIVGQDGGWLVPTDSTDAWTEALRTIQVEERALDARGAAGRQRFRTRFSEAAGLADLEGAYRDARALALRTER